MVNRKAVPRTHNTYEPLTGWGYSTISAFWNRDTMAITDSLKLLPELPAYLVTTSMHWAAATRSAD